MGPRHALQWDPEEWSPWLLVSRGASQLWGGMISSEWQGPWETVGVGGKLEKYLKYAEGKELVSALYSTRESRSGIAVPVLSVLKRSCQDLYWYLKSPVSAVGFSLKWGFRQQVKNCYLLIFARQGQKAGFLLTASYCGRGSISGQYIRGAQEIHTGFTFPDITAVSDRD